MDTVSGILGRSHVTVTLDGLEFVLRAPTMGLLIDALGPGAMTIVESASSGDLDVAEAHDMMAKVLAVALVTPKLGDVTDAENEVISWIDLGDFGPRLYAALWKTMGDKVENFTESSTVPKEPGPPER